jgi:hypothetical protein
MKSLTGKVLFSNSQLDVAGKRGWLSFFLISSPVNARRGRRLQMGE